MKTETTGEMINSLRHIEAIRQMRAGKGEIYERWKTRWEAATGLKITRRREKNADKSGERDKA